MDVEEELNRVYCRIRYFPRLNRFVVNDRICNEMTRRAVKRIQRYGIDCIEDEVNAFGGGSDNSFSSLLKHLWESRNIIGLLITTFKWLHFIIGSVFERQFVNSRPELTISLKIKKESDKGGWHAPIGDKLIDLKHLAEDLSAWLKEEYPIYSFDQHIEASFHSESFRVSVYQKDDQCNSFQNGRLIQRLKRIKERQNLDISIRILSPLFLRQSISSVTYQRYWMTHGKGKVFYTIFSSKLIIRYPRIDLSNSEENLA